MADPEKNSFKESAEALAKVRALVLDGVELRKKIQSLVDDFDKGRESVGDARKELSLAKEELLKKKEELVD